MEKSEKNNHDMLSGLIIAKLPNKNSGSFPKFIMNTFNAYCHHRIQIVINLPHVYRYSTKLCPLLIAVKKENVIFSFHMIVKGNFQG